MQQALQACACNLYLVPRYHNEAISVYPFVK